jgi:hypothetical protein
MADSSQAPRSAEEAPIGTLVILIVYLIVLVGIWGTVYLTMLQRG